MENTNLIHHYTNINTLELILKNRTIRFNRLDRVDDLEEGKPYGKYNVSKYLFVSCWTDSDFESIPQWNIYTDKMRGVRITLPKNMFVNHLIKPPNYMFALPEGYYYSPIPEERLLTDKYYVLPTFKNIEKLGKKVEYVDEPSEYYNDIVHKTKDKVYNSLTFLRPIAIAKYKRKVWEFQSEFRFILFIVPINVKPRGRVWSEGDSRILISKIISNIVNEVNPNLDYFDVDLNPIALNNIIVTIGPCASPGDKNNVESLIKQHTKNGVVENSKLHGTVRCTG
jgi:hypothetical protein